MIRTRPVPDVRRVGLSLIEILVVIAILAALFGLTLSAVQRVRSSASDLACRDRLRQIALATHHY